MTNKSNFGFALHTMLYLGTCQTCASSTRPFQAHRTIKQGPCRLHLLSGTRPCRRHKFQPSVGRSIIHLAITCTTVPHARFTVSWCCVNAHTTWRGAQPLAQLQTLCTPLLVRFLYKMRWPHSLHRITSFCPIWFSAPQSERDARRASARFIRIFIIGRDGNARPQMYFTGGAPPILCTPPPPPSPQPLAPPANEPAGELIARREKRGRLFVPGARGERAAVGCRPHAAASGTGSSATHRGEARSI